MNALHTALQHAADKHGAPAIGSYTGRAGHFPALRFGDDLAFVPNNDHTTIYAFDGRSTAAGVYNWRDLGTRDNVLDMMAEVAEQHLASKRAPVRDDYSAEWMAAEVAADAREAEYKAERAPFKPEKTKLYQWLITRFAIANPAWELMDMQPTERGIKIRIGMNSNEIISTPLMVVITGVLDNTLLDEVLTPYQIARVGVAARCMVRAGRIGKETVTTDESVERPSRYRVEDGWQVQSTQRVYPASNFVKWTMARGIVISAHEAAAVAAQEARA